VIPHIEQYSPVWLVSQSILPEDQSVRFQIVFEHHLYTWVKRQYLYDGFNDVLYHKGQTKLSNSEALEIQESEPWILTASTSLPNSYGG
jgi:hypothetical protein